MLTYRKINSLEFDLHNGYLLKVDYPYDKSANTTNKYYITFYIKDINVMNDKFFEKIDDVCEKEFISNPKFINTNISKYVEQLLEVNFFDKYIQEYEYNQICMFEGNDMFEKQQKENNNVSRM